jgi:hypothetical protein
MIVMALSVPVRSEDFTHPTSTLYIVASERLVQLRNVSLTIEPLSISPADKLNGIQWIGIVSLRFVGRSNRYDGTEWTWHDDWSLVTKLTRTTDGRWNPGRSTHLTFGYSKEGVSIGDGDQSYRFGVVDVSKIPQ